MISRVGVLYGGRSEEHEVSKCSAASVISFMDHGQFEPVAIGIDRDGRWYVQDRPLIVKDKNFGNTLALEKKGLWHLNHYECDGKLSLIDIESGRKVLIDIVFPVIHGTFCEDGTLQGLLELSMVPFVGAGTAGSVLGMDKDIMKRVLRDSGIPVVDWETIHRKEWDNKQADLIKKIHHRLQIPLFVKPSNSGSSVGISKVKKWEELSSAVDFAFKYDNKVIVENGLNAREIECSVLGNDEAKASVLGEVIPNHEFYSYEAKYIDSNGAELIIPANVDKIMSDSIRECALKIYSLLNCSGMARIDFFIDRENGKFYLNEINTLPGFTSVSMYPKLWEYSGIDYKNLITTLIKLGFERSSDLKRVRSIK